ncbi:MAG TPA: photosystem II protein PsbQ [Leptolyngbyaceae cyanobacterium M33_DOE_097]|uniref:Photosystem II protein PsbQ n=1 Tax=Oscillatoriales cyanobacterium SpSt-418 TaxID=2282169 RepID=A0A7C3KCX7_9CYAN|nr:photosystem II protein PsbQ [Leptolyngbyaceae cyanobacterium M33_DOE_097]
MVKFRAIISFLLVLVTVVVVNWGSPAAAKPPKKPTTYTTEQIQQLQAYAADVAEMRDRLPELADLIQKQNWVFVRNFIHGPLGEIRTKMLTMSRNLLPDAQKEANQLSKAVFDHLVDIDQAAASQNYKVAVRSYAETVRDLDTFLNLIPQG